MDSSELSNALKTRAVRMWNLPDSGVAEGWSRGTKKLSAELRGGQLSGLLVKNNYYTVIEK